MEIEQIKTMKAILYTRVSTKEQVENFSLSSQEKACREYAQRQEWEVIEVFKEEGESAKTANRTELIKLIEYCRKNKGLVDVLLVYKFDRFSRSSADHHTVKAILLKLGVKVRSATELVDDTPGGKFMESIFSAAAQFDNDTRSERTKAGMLEKLRQGQWPWKAPLGYKNSPIGLIVDANSAQFIKKAFEIYANGGYTIKFVVNKINRLGLRTGNGKKITSQFLIKMFSNKLYIGICQAWGETHLGIHKPLISNDLFYKVESIRLGRSVQASVSHSTNNHNFPLKNILKCLKCARNITASSSTGRSKKYSYYHCICGAVRVSKEVFENKFYDYLKYIQPNKEFNKIFKLLLVDIWKRKHAEEKKAIDEIDTEIFNLKELKKRLLVKNLQGTVSDKEYKEQVEAFSDQLAMQELERTELRSIEANMDHIVSLAESLLENVSSVWFEASFDNKQRFQSLMFPNGLPVSNENFGTATLGLPFNLIRDFSGDETTLVTPREFESRFSE